MTWEVVGGVGFRKRYTEEEWAEIERQREEMRKRLTAPEPSCHQTVDKQVT